MMSLVPKLLSRCSLAYASSPSSSRAKISVLRAMSTKANNIQKGVQNPEGPMLSGYQEYVDDVAKKAEAMHASVEALSSNYYGTDIRWMDRKTIDDLMDLTATHKREMKEKLEAVQKALEADKTSFAVDAPDGECDAHLEEEWEEVQHVVDNMTKKTQEVHESIETLGDSVETLGSYGTNIGWMEPKTIDDLMHLAETHKREMKEKLESIQAELKAAKSTYAVDAPDGECDAHLEEEWEEVQHIVDNVNKKTEEIHASTEMLNSNYGTNIGWMEPKTIEDLMHLAETHKREMKEKLEAVQVELEAAKSNYAVDAPDGECDAHLEEEFEEVKRIVEEEAGHKKTM